jgi:peroxiredoxin
MKFSCGKFSRFLTCLVILAGLLLSACGEPTGQPGEAVDLATARPTPGMGSLQETIAVTPASGPVKIRPGAAAPDFAVTDITGLPLKLSDHRGKAVIINYWSIYCDYCRQEMPELVKTYQANRDKLDIIGIDINDEPAEVQDFVHQLNITYPIVIDNTGDLVYKYRITGRPTSIFINKEGLITGVVPGMTTPQVLEEQLSRVLQ